jgi:hypothetical protein
MTAPPNVRCYGRVDRSYELVRDALDGLVLTSAGAAPLRVQSLCHQESLAGLPAVTRATIGSMGANSDVPEITSEVYASRVSSSETQIEVDGHFPLPGKPETGASRAPAAEAYVRRLLEDIIESLRRTCRPGPVPDT